MASLIVGDHRLLLRLLKGMMQQPAEKPSGKHSFLKTVQAKQCSPKNRLQQKEKHHTSYKVQCFFGGEYRDRTGDLLHAMQALSQLS